MLDKFDFIDINDYRKLKIIGNGSCGKVFRVQEKSSGKLFAAKIFKNVYYKNDNKVDLKQVTREASVYSKIQHPAVARYYGVSPFDFDNEPFPCLILDYYKNQSLRSLIYDQEAGKCPPEWNNTKILINLYGIAAGVAFLHSKNIIYRDLKPDNILEDENYYPKLSDFGISKIIDDGTISYGGIYGTPLYMAPEIVENNEYTFAVDVYAYAILAYQLLVSDDVFPNIKNSAFNILRNIMDGQRPEFTKPIPDCYRSLIESCWDMDPNKRPSFDDIVCDLKNNYEFITEFNVDEEEYYSYIEKIESGIFFSEQVTELIENDDKPLNINVKSIDLNKYTRKKQIGEGAFGVVYEVENKLNKIIYAAKVSKSEIYESVKKDRETVNFIREVTILSKINHPSIMKFIGFSPINFKNVPKPVIITELLKNGTLEDVIELERKGLSNNLWNETKKLINIYGIASSMAYLHSLDILHRDLKPANILVDDYLFPKLADFGLSKDQMCKSEECKQVNPTGLIGTPMYISPEIYNQNNYTKACDVYAFAFIVYEIMTSEVPLIGSNRYQVMWNIMKGIRPSFSFEIPKCYKNLIERCWDMDPNKRPSFDDIVYDLKNDPEFITDLVEEGEFLDYVDMIENKLRISTKFQKVDISIGRDKEEEKVCQNISYGKGFIDIDKFKKQKQNGKNEFWKFYNVTSKNGTFSAKMSIIPLSNFTVKEMQSLINEVAVLSTLDHPSLLKFIGYSSVNFKKEPKPVIITEPILKQTLENIIEMNRKDIRSRQWDSTKILMNIFGIASAMSYLHSFNIIHSELKPGNIFIDIELLPKLTDYGFYTKYQVMKSMTCQSSSKMKNVPNYSAPEILNSEAPSKASDVYSFALIVYELMTKEKPFSHLKTTNEIFFEVVAKSGRPKFPESPKEEIPECFREMIEACWSQDPNQRPTFDNIVNALKTDRRFLANEVNEKEFFRYVEMVENKRKPEMQQKTTLKQSQPIKIRENDFQKVVEENENLNQSPIPQQVSRPLPAKKKNPSTVQAANIEGDSDLSSVYNEIREDGSGTNWILVRFNTAVKKWEFHSKGSGGQEEMKDKMPSDFIGYCYLRTETVNRDINRTYFILIKYVPTGTKMMTKAVMNTKRGEIENVFNYSNITLEIGSKEEISKEISKNLK
ncbi:hypothetical protein M9Y10_008773 [Tritrichomonas musculus]|uniref:Protein kinase domain-containing protein n=1 Tax=Tritrichomonas musculus TaxID=1915356 RepID=A0ABR2IZ27_9EUKA